MTIEIADRLVKLRKKNGLSQEELADKLGLSRQAVSKWERAEASPDTDNLICLAKLYGISLDELLSTDDDVDTIVKEQVKKEEIKEGIHLVDDDGSEVHIDKRGIHSKDCSDNEVKKEHFKDKGIMIIEIIEGALFLLSIIAYVLIGVLLGMWRSMWILLLVPSILCSLARAVYKRNGNKFNMIFTALFVYIFVCMVKPGGLWHPMWLVFLAIPAYYIIVGTIRKITGKREIDNQEDEDDD